MNKISDTLTRQDLIRFADGNIGAAMLLGRLEVVTLIDGHDDFFKVFINALKKAELKGTSIYVLWKDLANEDFKRLNQICRNVPSDKLKEACDRQDRKGIDIIKPYL